MCKDYEEENSWIIKEEKNEISTDEVEIENNITVTSMNATESKAVNERANVRYSSHVQLLRLGRWIF